MQSMTYELERLIGDDDGTADAALVVVGHRLGLYKALAGMGPATGRELAAVTRTHEMYVSAWLAAQAAAGHVTQVPAAERFHMTLEQAVLLADENGPHDRMNDFDPAASMTRDNKRRPRTRPGGGSGRTRTLVSTNVL